MKIVHLFIILFILLNLTSCAAIEKSRQIKELSQGNTNEDEQWRTYIQNVLYVGMPESNFLELFTKVNFEGNLSQPYIITHIDNQYIILEFPNLNKSKARITFVNGTLNRYERFGLGQNPFGYSDSTFLLRGYRADGPGFYTSMSEVEFMQKFSASIISHSGNYYEVIGKNERRYRVIFSNGSLTGIESLQ